MINQDSENLVDNVKIPIDQTTRETSAKNNNAEPLTRKTSIKSDVDSERGLVCHTKCPKQVALKNAERLVHEGVFTVHETKTELFIWLKVNRDCHFVIKKSHDFQLDFEYWNTDIPEEYTQHCPNFPKTKVNTERKVVSFVTSRKIVPPTVKMTTRYHPEGSDINTAHYISLVFDLIE